MNKMAMELKQLLLLLVCLNGIANALTMEAYFCEGIGMYEAYEVCVKKQVTALTEEQSQQEISIIRDKLFLSKDRHWYPDFKFLELINVRENEMFVKQTNKDNIWPAHVELCNVKGEGFWRNRIQFILVRYDHNAEKVPPRCCFVPFGSSSNKSKIFYALIISTILLPFWAGIH